MSAAGRVEVDGFGVGVVFTAAVVVLPPKKLRPNAMYRAINAISPRAPAAIILFLSLGSFVCMTAVAITD
jgi:hypothetical protein